MGGTTLCPLNKSLGGWYFKSWATGYPYHKNTLTSKPRNDQVLLKLNKIAQGQNQLIGRKFKYFDKEVSSRILGRSNSKNSDTDMSSRIESTNDSDSDVGA